MSILLWRNSPRVPLAIITVWPSGCHRHRVIMVELREAADKQTGPSGL
jgi:hypothetical protein